MTLQRIIFWILAWILAGLTLPLKGQEKASTMDSLLNIMATTGRFTGSVLVYQKGEVLFNKAYGFSDAEKKAVNTPQGIYQTYSITKSFTSTMILLLVEQGKLSLKEPLSKFYPKVKGAEQINVEQLLSHQSGLYDYTRLQDTTPMSLEKFVKLMEQQPLDFPPGTQWNYCNSGYWFLGLIIEKLTGLAYDQAITNYIFQPLGMTHSGFNYKNLQDGYKTRGYALYGDGVYQPAETYAPPGPYAAGDIWSTTADLLRFHQGMQRNTLISAPMQANAYQPRANQYGLGWMTDSIAGKQIVKHSGGAAGFRSMLLRVPEDDLCVIILSNAEQDINMLSSRITDIVYQRPVHIPMHRQISSAILKRYEGWYRLNPQMILQVYALGDQLVIQPSAQPRTILFTERENLFYVNEIDGFVRFLSDGKTFDTLDLYQRNKWHKAPRMNVVWGITGSATAQGWDGPDIAMIPGKTTAVWEARNVKLGTGEIKFRMNNSWDWNYGVDEAGNLLAGGANIKVAGGVYDITIDLRDPDHPIYIMKIRE